MTCELSPRDDGIPNLAEEVAECVRRVGNQNRVAVIVCCDVFQRIEVLRHQHELHHVLRSRTRNGFREVFHRIFQPRDDRFPLIRDAFSLQAFRFGSCSRLLHQQHLIRLRPRDGRFPFPLRGVDVVHRGLHLLVGHDVGDQDFHDGVAVLLHRGVQVVSQIVRNVRLVQKGIIQFHFRNVAQNYVVHHGFDLLHRVGQFVERGFDCVGNHFVLDRDGYLNEDVVLGFRLYLHVELLDLHAQPANHSLEIRRLPIQTRASNARKFSQPLHDGYLRRLNREERTQGYAQNEKPYDDEQNQKSHHWIHVHSPFSSPRSALKFAIRKPAAFYLSRAWSQGTENRKGEQDTGGTAREREGQALRPYDADEMKSTNCTPSLESVQFKFTSGSGYCLFIAAKGRGSSSRPLLDKSTTI